MDGRFDSTLHDEFRRRLLASRESLLRTVAASDEEVSALEAPGPGDSLDNASARSITTLMSRLAGSGEAGARRGGRRAAPAGIGRVRDVRELP